MNPLVCDICGGKLVMGTGGIAICNNCGMEYSIGRIKEKVQEITGTVYIDNSNMVDNWMRMGLSATQAGNHKEAYEYFTKVVEVDPENWRAIYEKGKAAAWQSTLDNLRIAEMHQGILMALEIIKRSDLSEKDLIGIKNEFAVALFNVNNAITDLMDRNLNSLDDIYFDLHWDQMYDTHVRHITNVEQLEDAMSLIADLDDDLSKRNVIAFKMRMCDDLQSACESIQYWRDYSQSSLDYFGYTQSEKKQYLNKYWQLVQEIRKVEPRYAMNKAFYPDPFDPGLHTPDERYEYWREIEEKQLALEKKKAAKKRFEKYWYEHADVKASLEAEKDSLAEQISALTIEMENIPAIAEEESIQERINDLIAKRNSLSIFKSKEKKIIQEQIDSAKLEREEVANRIDASIKKFEEKIKLLQARYSEITTELTKAR